MLVYRGLIMLAILGLLLGLGYAFVAGHDLASLYTGLRDTIGGYWDAFVQMVNRGLARADPRNWANESWTKELHPGNWDWTARADPRNWDSPLW